MTSPSNPTIRYGTSSTELFSFFESWKKEDDDDNVGVASVSVRLILVSRLLPPDCLFGDDVTVTMSSEAPDAAVGGTSGTADVLTGASVGL